MFVWVLDSSVMIVTFTRSRSNYMWRSKIIVWVVCISDFKADNYGQKVLLAYFDSLLVYLEMTSKPASTNVPICIIRNLLILGYVKLISKMALRFHVKYNYFAILFSVSSSHHISC